LKVPHTLNPAAHFPVVAIVSLAFFAMFTAYGYRIWVRPGVCAHFGEEFASRSDRETSKHRRSFEWRCGWVLGWLYVSFVAGTIRVIVAERMPELERFF